MSYFQDDRPEKLGQSILDLVSTGAARPAYAPKLPTWSQSVEDLIITLGLGAGAEWSRLNLRSEFSRSKFPFRFREIADAR